VAFYVTDAVMAEDREPDAPPFSDRFAIQTKGLDNAG